MDFRINRAESGEFAATSEDIPLKCFVYNCKINRTNYEWSEQQTVGTGTFAAMKMCYNLQGKFYNLFTLCRVHCMQQSGLDVGGHHWCTMISGDIPIFMTLFNLQKSLTVLALSHMQQPTLGNYVFIPCFIIISFLNLLPMGI